MFKRVYNYLSKEIVREGIWGCIRLALGDYWAYIMSLQVLAPIFAWIGGLTLTQVLLVTLMVMIALLFWSFKNLSTSIDSHNENHHLDCSISEKKKLKRAVKKINNLFINYKNWGQSKDTVLKVSNYLNKAVIYADSDKANTIFTELNHSIGILISLKNEGYREGHQEIKDAKEVFKKYSNQLMEIL